MNLPDSITSIVANASKLPEGMMRLMIRRSVVALPAEAKGELWAQIKDVDVDALAAIPPEQWPDNVPASMQKSVLVMMRVAQDTLRKELAK